MRWSSFVLGLAVVFLSVQASAEDSSPATAPLHLLTAEGGAIMAAQSGGSTYSFLFRYLPEYTLSGSKSDIAVGLDLGYSVFGSVTNVNFSVIEYGAQASYRIDEHWGARLFLGAQTWTGGFGGTSFFFGPEIQYHFRSERSLLDHVFLAYTPDFQSSVAHELSAGIGVAF
jgi:hypothetical protein